MTSFNIIHKLCSLFVYGFVTLATGFVVLTFGFSSVIHIQEHMCYHLSLFNAFSIIWKRPVIIVIIQCGINTLYVYCRIHNLQDFINYTVKSHLSVPHLSGLSTYPVTCLGTNCDNIKKKWLIYPDIHLSRQSAWERRIFDYSPS